MELRHLRYFIAVAESLHFGQAAATLHIAQPSLSHQIRQLETELHTTLLRRTKRRVELTDAGRLFLEEARDVVARADRAAMVARRIGHAEAGRLRVGVGYCMDQLDVAKTVSRFNRQEEVTGVELHTMAVPAQYAALREGRLDVGFVRPPVPDAALSSEILTREELVIALPLRHRAARAHTISLAALANEPFVLPPRELVPVYHDIVLKTCREAGFVPNAPHEADHLQLMLGMVAEGSGVALAPASARKMKQHRLAFAALRPPVPTLEVAVAWPRENASAMLNEFLKAARQVMGSNRARL
jgi:DNA-binding transcriptional LysR family regulator